MTVLNTASTKNAKSIFASCFLCRRLIVSIKKTSVTKATFGTGQNSTLPYNVLECWEKRLQENGIPEPDYSVKWIADHVNNLYQISNGSNGRSSSKLDAVAEFEKLCWRRLKREPVQYIVGNWDFRFINLIMRPPVFIPRSETEGLVDLVNKKIQKTGSLIKKILEVGCGSGAISLSLAKENPEVSCTAIDVSKEAVYLAMKNCERCEILHFSFDEYQKLHNNRRLFDALVSNPPYVPTEDMKDLAPEISMYEDTRALHGGETGLDMVLDIISNARMLVRKNGFIWLEVDSSHPTLIEDIVEQDFKDQVRFLGFYHDIYERPRFCQLQVMS